MEIKWQLWVHNGLQHSGKHQGQEGKWEGSTLLVLQANLVTSAKTSSEALPGDQLLDTECTLAASVHSRPFIRPCQLIYVPYSREGPDVEAAVADLKGLHKYRKLSAD